MIRSLITLIIFVISLHALNNTEVLKRANKLAKSPSKTNQFRAYNDYKNLYLRALINENKKLRINSLKGIVNSGKKLHIDISKYAKELNRTQLRILYKPKKSKPIIKENRVKIKSSHRLKSIRWENKKLVMSFDKKLLNNQINYFTMYDSKTKKYKYVFDVHASMLKRSQTLRKEDIEKIKLAQFQPNTLRLVIQDSSKVKIKFYKENKKLVVSMIATKSKLHKKHVSRKKPPLRLDRNKVIVIDAGHGGKDPGAVGYKKYREKIIVLKIAQELKNILKSRGFKVYMTRDSDRFVKLSKRTKFANNKKADLFISIHANAVGAKIAKKVEGIECYFLAKSRSSRAKKVAEKENRADLSEMDFYGKQSFLNTLNSHNIVAANKLAIDLQRSSLASLNKFYKGVKDAGVREGPFWVLVGAQMPAVLVEVGFITHPKEALRLVSRKYQKNMALGLANGVERYFLNN